MSKKYVFINALLVGIVFYLIPFLGLSAELKKDILRDIEIISKDSSLSNPVILSDNLVNTVDSLILENSNLVEQVTDSSLMIPEKLLDQRIDFNLNSEIFYLKVVQFRKAEAREAFILAWKQKQQTDESIEQLSRLRLQYQKTNSSDEKDEIAKKVLALELEVINLKQASDSNFLKARNLESLYWESATKFDRDKLRMETDSIRGSMERQLLPPIVESTSVIDTISAKDSREREDSISHEPIDVKPEQMSFDDRVLFKVQIGTFDRNILPVSTQKLFKRLSVFRKIDHFTDGKGIEIYTIGELVNFKDAVKLQTQIRQEGIKDAFVVAYKSGKRITLSEARKITGQ
jgi:hypothetical protein